MREPDSWWQPDGGSPWLRPIAGLYGAVSALRMQSVGRNIGVPVICVGNLTVGGGGKTPAALEIGRLLLAAHERLFFLSRGYGGRLRGPVRVDPATNSAAAVGDEPLLLARLAPTIVARNRVAGAETARRSGATVIVMDDGFQNPSLHKDVALLMVDGRRGIGNGRIVPAGPLRAPLETQIRYAHALVVVGPPEGAAEVVKAARRRDIVTFHARLEPDQATIAAIGARKVLAFAGIADPQKFFATLEHAGVQIGERVAFADHHRYTASEARGLLARAEAASLLLLTTEKDLARLAGEPRLKELAARASALPVRLVIDRAEEFRALILQALSRRAGRTPAAR